MRNSKARFAAFLWLCFAAAGSVCMAQVTISSSGGASLTAANTWSALQTFSVAGGSAITLSGSGGFITMPSNGSVYFGGTMGGRIGTRTEQTPDTMVLATGSLGNSIIFGEETDVAFDRAIPLQTNPTFFAVPAAQETTQRSGIAYYGLQGRAVKTLTESAATTAVQIPVAALTGVGGTVSFTVFAADAVDAQTLSGVIQYAAVNKAGTETCATPTAIGTPLNSVSAGTLTCTYACDTGAANAVNIQFNCVSSLTQTTLEVYWRVNALGASEPLPQ